MLNPCPGDYKKVCRNAEKGYRMLRTIKLNKTTKDNPQHFQNLIDKTKQTGEQIIGPSDNTRVKTW